jgi:hypothetical protein
VIFQSEMIQEIPIESINKKMIVVHVSDLSAETVVSEFEVVYFHHYDYKNILLKKFDFNKNVSAIERPFYYYKKIRSMLTSNEQ